MSIMAEAIGFVEESFDWSYQPTPKQDAEETGYQIGLEGQAPSFRDAYPAATIDQEYECALAFTAGRERGRAEHARRAGRELGLAGDACDRPESIPRRFDRDFVAGWEAGTSEWAARMEVMAQWQREDERDEMERCFAEQQLRRDNAEAGGWYRAWGVAVD